MLHDVVINPFGGDPAPMASAAAAAERLGYDGVWVTDHFSGSVVDAPWSRDPFVCLGAIAGTTEHIRIGLLVANMVNRHPAQLASAINSVQSLAPNRVVLGVGSGAAPGSRFAVEHDAIGRPLDGISSRRRQLAGYIGALRAIWDREERYDDETFGFEGLSAVTDGAPPPPIVVGASAWPTIEVAARIADGVNIRRTAALAEDLERLTTVVTRPGFEVSVLDHIPADPEAHGVPGEFGPAGVDRWIRTLSAPFELGAPPLVG